MTVFDENQGLLLAFREGARDALTLVYQHYVDEVAQGVRRGFFLGEGRERIPGVTDIQIERELTQEVFLRAFSRKARNAYDGLRPYRPYLMRIVRNLLIDHWRKQGRELAHLGEQEPEDWQLSEDDREPDLDWDNQLEATRQYLAGLDPWLREFVSLRFEEGNSQYQVMEQLKITRWRVRAIEKKVQTGLIRHLKRQGLISR